jgi:hypothetical protein
MRRIFHKKGIKLREIKRAEHIPSMNIFRKPYRVKEWSIWMP